MRNLKLFFLSFVLIIASLHAADDKPLLQGGGAKKFYGHSSGEEMQDCRVESKGKKPVLLTLGVDGIYGPLFEAMMKSGDLPNFQAVKKMSAWTLEASTIYPPHSLIVWSAFLYGKQPTLWQKVEDTFLDVNRSEVATRNHGTTNLCSAVGDKDSTFVTTNWGPIADIIPDDEATKVVIPYKEGTDEEQDDIFVFAEVQKAIKSNQYTYIFAQLDYSDAVASADGIGETYENALRVIDKQLGEILNNCNLDFKNRDYLCITSDHGRNSWCGSSVVTPDCLSCMIPDCWAIGKKHGCLGCDTVKHIPLFVAGPSIEGHEITDEVSIEDIAPSLLALMGKDKGDMEGNVIDFKTC